MEPITAIVSALAAGAAAAFESTAQQVIKDAYQGLKALIKKKWGGVDVDVLESAPESKTRRAVLEEELTKTACAHDQEVLQHTQELLKLLSMHAPEALQRVGVSLQDIDVTGSVRIANVAGQDRGVDIKGAKIGQDLDISGITAGNVSHGGTPPNP